MVWIRLYLDCLKFSVDCHVRSAELCDVNVLAVEFVKVTTANIDPSALFLQVRSYWQNEEEERFTSQAEQIIGHFVSHTYRLVSRNALNQNQPSLLHEVDVLPCEHRLKHNCLWIFKQSLFLNSPLTFLRYTKLILSLWLSKHPVWTTEFIVLHSNPAHLDSEQYKNTP